MTATIMLQGPPRLDTRLLPMNFDRLLDHDLQVRSMLDMPLGAVVSDAPEFSVSGEAEARWIRGAAIFGASPAVCVMNGDTPICFKESSAYDGHAEMLLDQARVEECSTLAMRIFDGECALVGGQWSTNFWHHHIEYLPYALRLVQQGFEGRYVVYNNHRFVIESLKLIGVPPDRIISYDHLPSSFEKLLLFRRIDGQNAYLGPQLIKNAASALREIAKPQRTDRRLYIARRESRMIQNEAHVLDGLTEIGFVKVYMEDYPLIEQYKLAAESECILGPHGAGMTGAMLMAPGGRLIELFAPGYINPCMIDVCLLLGIDYNMYVSRLIENYYFGSNIHLDKDICRSILSLFK